MFFQRPGSIQNNIFFSFALLLILLGIILFISINLLAGASLEKQVRHSEQADLKQAAVFTQSLTDEMVNLAQSIAGSKAIESALKNSNRYYAVINFQKSLEDFLLISSGLNASITVIDAKGRFYSNWQTDGQTYKNIAVSLKKYTEYRQLEQGLINSCWLPVSPSFIPFSGSENWITYAQSLIDRKNNYKKTGILMVSIPVSRLQPIIGKISQWEGRTCWIEHSDGSVIAHSGSRGTGPEKNRSGRQIVLTEQMLIPDWKIISRIPYKSFMGEVIFIRRIIFFCLAVSLGLAFLLSYYIAQQLSLPIQRLITTMNQIKENDFSARVETNSQNELGDLSRTFNLMIDTIQVLQSQREAEETRRHQAELVQKDLELKVLRSQINPHFLFNSLNSIKCLAIINKTDHVANMIASLGVLLENTLKRADEPSTVGEELSILDHYFRLQKIRFGSSLTLRIFREDIEDNYPLPRLILTTIVENSIIHGGKEETENLSISIEMTRNGNVFQIKFQDNGKGFGSSFNPRAVLDYSAMPNTPHGTGLKNIQSRIHHIYGKDWGITMNNGRQGGACVIIQLPFQEGPYENCINS